jgi:hypothetical protein
MVIVQRQHDVIDEVGSQFDLDYSLGTALIAGLDQPAIVVAGMRDAPIVRVIS